MSGYLKSFGCQSIESKSPSFSPTLGIPTSTSLSAKDTGNFKKALLYFTVNVVGFATLSILYLNFILLRPYITPLFWAVTLSVPLHSLKSELLILYRRGLEKEKISVIQEITFPIRFLLKVIFGRHIIGCFSFSWERYYGIITMLSDFRRATAERRNSYRDDGSETVSSAKGMDEESAKGMGGDPAKGTDGDSFYSSPGLSRYKIEGKQLGQPEKFAEGAQSMSDLRRESTTPSAASTPLLGQSVHDRNPLNRFRRTSDVHATLSERFAHPYRNDFMVWLCRLCLLRVAWLLIARETLLVAMLLVIGLTVALILMRWTLRLVSGLCSLDGVRWLLLGGEDLIRGTVFDNGLAKAGDFVGKALRQFLLRNLNSLLTLFIIVLTLATASMLTGYIALKVGEEAKTLLNLIIHAVNDPSASHQLDPSQRVRFNNLIIDFKGRAISYLDNILLQRGINTSTSNILIQLSDIYFGLVSPPVSTSNKHWFRQYLPTTSLLLDSVLVGNFTAVNVHSLDVARTELQRMIEYKGSVDIVTGIGRLLSEGLDALGLNALSVLNLALAGYSYVFSFFLFVVTLYTLVSNEYGTIHHVSRVWHSIDPKQQIRSSVEETLNAVWLCTVKITSFHVLFTWLTFSLARVQFVYISVLITALLALIPLINVSIVALPAAYHLWTNGSHSYAVALFLSHVFANWSVDAKIYETIPDAHPFYSSLAVFVGWSAFGLEGLILGPLLMACVPLAYKWFGEVLRHLEHHNSQPPSPPSRSGRVIKTYFGSDSRTRKEKDSTGT